MTVAGVPAGLAEKLANVTSVAEVVQRAVLRLLPRRVGPLELDVVYLAAAAEARVGGDLYEVARTPFGIRLIVGDASGKRLEAVGTAAAVLGVFREVAHEVYTLAEVARRLDASLARRRDGGRAPGSRAQEEFVTAVLAEIDPCAGGLTIYNCGHPPPLLLTPGIRDARDTPGRREGPAAPSVTMLEVPSPAPPLRLLPLGDCSGAARALPLRPCDALLLYTVGEARNPRHGCYPSPTRPPRWPPPALAASVPACWTGCVTTCSGMPAQRLGQDSGGLGRPRTAGTGRWGVAAQIARGL